MVQVQLHRQCLISNLETRIPHKCKVCLALLLYVTGYQFNIRVIERNHILWEQLAVCKVSSSLLLCMHSTLPDHQFSTYTIYSSKRPAMWLILNIMIFNKYMTQYYLLQ